MVLEGCRVHDSVPDTPSDLLVKERPRDQRPHLPDPQILGFLDTDNSKSTPRRLEAQLTL